MVHSNLVVDLRRAARALAQKPAFAAAAVLSLALGIGANAAIFRVVVALLMKPIPGVERPERLAGLFETLADSPGRFSSVSYSTYRDYRDLNPVFSALATYAVHRPFVLSGGSVDSERIFGEFVSANYFHVLGVRPAAGRMLRPGEDTQPMVVLSHRLWTSRFGADPYIAGQTVRVNRHEFTVAGVAAAEFRGVRMDLPAEMWVPIGMYPQLEPRAAETWLARGTRWLQVIGRLRPGITIQQAEAALQPMARRLSETHAESRGRGAAVFPGNNTQLAVKQRKLTIAYLGMLMAAAGLVLLIACANVASLLLARATERQRELGIRLALGAGRARIAQHVLAESIVLAAAAGAVGLVLASMAGVVVRNFALPNTPGFTLETGLEWPAFLFTAAISLLTGLVFGMAPAIEAARINPAQSLNETGTAYTSRRGLRLRNGFAVAQVAVSAVLLVAAGLFLQAFRAAWGSMAAKDPDRLLLVTADPGRARYSEIRGRLAYREIRDRMAALPGVTGAAWGESFPGALSETTGALDSHPGEGFQVSYNVVGPGYFTVVGARVVGGRDFSSTDVPGAPEAAIVNETAAKRFWTGRSPLGGRIRLGASGGTFREVVGIVRDDAAEPVVYIPSAQEYLPRMILHIRATDARRAASAVRAELKRVDPDLGVAGVESLSQVLDQVLVQHRMAASLTAVFGGLALVLATLGIYSLMTYVTSRRAREMGIRLALGATRRDLLNLVLGRGMRLAGAGLVIGLAAALACTRFLAAFIYGVSPADPATFAAVCALLLGTSAAATFVPAWRASRLDPVRTLRM